MGEDQEFRQETQHLQLGFRTNVSRFRDAGVEFGFFSRGGVAVGPGLLKAESRRYKRFFKLI